MEENGWETHTHTHTHTLYCSNCNTQSVNKFYKLVDKRRHQSAFTVCLPFENYFALIYRNIHSNVSDRYADWFISASRSS